MDTHPSRLIVRTRLFVLALSAIVLVLQTRALAGTVVAWGNADNYGVFETVPAGLTNVIGVSAGSGFTLALMGDGTVTNWGSSHSLPGTGTPPTGLTNVEAIAAGSGHGVALRYDGTVVAWGDNSVGETNVPPGLNNVVAIAATGEHTLALRGNGTVIAWGLNDQGQTNVPAGLSNVVAIAAGYSQSLALKSDGTVVGWGANAWGKPYLVLPGLSNVVAIGVGSGHFSALKSDGTVVGWGHIFFDGSDPSPPPGLSNVVGIASGGSFSMALKADGSVVPWGDDLFGELKSPSTLTNATVISANLFHGVALVGEVPPLRSGEPLFLFPFPITQDIILDRTIQPIVNTSLQLYPAGFDGWPINYQWEYNGTNVPGATDAALVLTNLQFSQNGDYALVITNGFGSPRRAVIHLAVAPFAIKDQPEDQSVLGGTNVEFDVMLDGVGPFSYQWLHGGTNVPGATNASLIVTNVFPVDSGAYSVLVSNNYGAIQSADALLSVSPFAIDAQPQDRQVLGGTNLQLAVTVAGTGPFAYQWRFDGTDLVGQTNSVLMFTNLAPANSGSYSVAIHNPYGIIVSSNAQLVVQPFAITTQPVGVATYPGASVSFAVTAAGTGPFYYQWLFNGTNVAGATNSALTLTNVDSHRTGFYSAIITNAFGVLTSSNAELFFSPVAGWGDDSGILTTIPLDLPRSNMVMIAVQNSHGLALISDGTVRAWGDDTYGESDTPVGLSNVVAIAAGGYQSLALLNNGTVVSWGAIASTDYGLNPTVVPAGLSNVVGLASGVFQNLVLTASNTVFAWGDNWDGEASVPQNLTNVVALAAGVAHNLALKADGTVTAWGYDHEGEANVPPGLSNVVAIAAGDYFSLALLSNGTVVGWGDNSAGQCNPPSGLANVAAISGGGHHSAALRNDGTVVAWGSNVRGQTTVPPTLTNVVAISAGSNSSLALFGMGPPFVTLPALHLTIVGGQSVYFPAAGTGSLPLSYQWQYNGTPIPGQNSKVLALVGTQAMSGNYSLTISNADGTASSSNMVLTTIPLVLSQQPQSQTALAGVTVTLSVAGTGWAPFQYQWICNGTNLPGATNATLLLTNLQPIQAGAYSAVVGNVFGAVMSSNAFLTVNPLAISTQPKSQSTVLGGAAAFSATPTFQGPFAYQWRLNGTDLAGATSNPLVLSNVHSYQAGNYSVRIGNGLGFVLSSNASLSVSPLAVWGDNTFKQTVPPTGLSNAVAIAAGGYHGLALMSNGTVIAWGDNQDHQTNVPAGLSNVVAIAAGLYHSLALKNDGTVIAWGNNGTHQTSVPAGLSNAVAVAAGSYFSLALQTNGRVVAWGDKTFGQTNVPAGLSNVVAIAGGGYHVLALTRDGRVTGWGLNAYGQTAVPTGLSNVVAISAGLYHSLALRNDGTLLVWGNNAYGQTNVPVGLSNIVAVAGGSYHSLALGSGGTVTAWGLNSYGQTTIPAAAHNVEAIAAGAYYSLTLLNDGNPFVIRQPLSQTVYAGTDLVMSLAATGMAPLFYQWRFNGTNVDQATNALLILTNVALACSGDYTCVVDNGLGSTSSLSLNVVVLRTTPQFGSHLQAGSGGFGFQLNGLSGHGPAVIYVSTNLQDWAPLFTNPPTIGSLQFLDSAATNRPLQFYKAVEQ
jgi:alpha-tubulin suppressor-like RCC1 family protein